MVGPSGWRCAPAGMGRRSRPWCSARATCAPGLSTAAATRRMSSSRGGRSSAAKLLPPRLMQPLLLTLWLGGALWVVAFKRKNSKVYRRAQLLRAEEEAKKKEGPVRPTASPCPQCSLPLVLERVRMVRAACRAD